MPTFAFILSRTTPRVVQLICADSRLVTGEGSSPGRWNRTGVQCVCESLGETQGTGGDLEPRPKTNNIKVALRCSSEQREHFHWWPPPSVSRHACKPLRRWTLHGLVPGYVRPLTDTKEKTHSRLCAVMWRRPLDGSVSRPQPFICISVRAVWPETLIRDWPSGFQSVYRGGSQQAAAARYTASVRHNGIHNRWVKNTAENRTLQLDLLPGVTPHSESRNGNSKTTVVAVCSGCSNSDCSEVHVKLRCSVCRTLCPLLTSSRHLQ